MRKFFTTEDIFKITGVTKRKIIYLDKINLVKPCFRRKSKYRLYSFEDLVFISLVIFLKERGTSLQKIRKKIFPNLLRLIKNNKINIDNICFWFGNLNQIIASNGEIYTSGIDLSRRFSVEDLKNKVEKVFNEK